MRAGEQVTPQVRLVRAIGAGGMGSVWVADHLTLKTQVAVKFILAGRENETDARERFSREAEAAAQVKSPHVAQIFDHGVTDDGIPFIVMELLEGKTSGVTCSATTACSSARPPPSSRRSAARSVARTPRGSSTAT
ncbi:MAG: protein kinase [Myxococcales bacterium]|nr:protein kinase [Myxococcales bacterium]